MGDNVAKVTLIPHTILWGSPWGKKALAHEEGVAAYQLVGEVMAHQGDDG